MAFGIWYTTTGVIYHLIQCVCVQIWMPVYMPHSISQLICVSVFFLCASRLQALNLIIYVISYHTIGIAIRIESQLTYQLIPNISHTVHRSNQISTHRNMLHIILEWHM